MISIDDIMSDNGLDVFDVDKAIEDSKVDLDKPMQPEPILLSYGEDWKKDPLCIFGEGDYSVITGVGNSKKTFLKTALVSSYIGGNTNFGQFKTHRTDYKLILDIDTEQSITSSQKAFRRVRGLVGDGYKNYLPFYLRKYNHSERLQVIDRLIEKFGNSIGLISIDGYADLVRDTNDNIESMALAQKIMTWTDEYSFHVTGILHENPKSDKMRGHLGSEMSRKASTILRVIADDIENNKSAVYHEKARDEKFKPFEFMIDKNLPKYIGEKY